MGSTAYEREMSTPPTLLLEYGPPLSFTFMCEVALEKMDSMLSSPTRWSCQYQEAADIDEFKLSECGEAFMMLVSTLTGLLMPVSFLVLLLSFGRCKENNFFIVI